MHRANMAREEKKSVNTDFSLEKNKKPEDIMELLEAQFQSISKWQTENKELQVKTFFRFLKADLTMWFTDLVLVTQDLKQDSLFFMGISLLTEEK